jgi:FolB domain-containing protein
MEATTMDRKFRMTQNDRITFDGIPLQIIIGADPEELRHRQTILVSLDVGVPRRIMRRAARTDLLKDAVDFKPLVDLVHAVGEGSTSKKRKYNLLETLAADIARAALERFPIRDIRVAIQKPLRYGTVGGIGVDMQWTRS